MRGIKSVLFFLEDRVDQTEMWQEMNCTGHREVGYE